MIETMLYSPQDKSFVHGGSELIQRWQENANSQIWVKIKDEEPVQEATLLADVFGINSHAIADAQLDQHPPKIEAFDGSSFILLKALDSSSTTIDHNTIQLAMFVGERFLVTRSSDISRSVNKLWKQMLGGDHPPDLPRAVLALRICRAVSDRFLPGLMKVEKRLEEMEEEMLDKPSDTLLGELVRQKGDLRRMLRVLQYHAQVFGAADKNTPKELEGHRHDFVDVLEQLERHLSLARLYYDLTEDLINGYLSLSAHRLNQIMQTLTIVTVIFVPITFMAGLYGMNFEHIPELSVRNGYYILLSAMLVVVAGILTFFYRKGWLVSRGSKK